MSKQQFSAAQREAFWVSYDKKCAYTRELLDLSSFHIDHIVPESLADNPAEFERVKKILSLKDSFDIHGYENLLPCCAAKNLQKSALVFDPAPVHYYLAIAASKKSDIESHLLKIEKRNIRGKALILLQQCLERKELTPLEVVKILEKYDSKPEDIFQLIESMHFSTEGEVRAIAKSDIEKLRNQPIKIGVNDHIDGVNLTNDMNDEIYVKTCQEYDSAIKAGYYPYSNFDIKISVFFEHQCGLLQALQAAITPQLSFIAEPRVGIVDLDLLPFSFFPCFEEGKDEDTQATYQSKVDDGTIIIKRSRQNFLKIEEPNGMGQQFIEVARADFNGDGIEDILLFEYCYATHGTLGYGGVRIITRKSNEGKFEVVFPQKSIK